MQIWWELFLGFFLANFFGYGGGPASIPLMYKEVVPNHGWMTSAEFTNVLALGNSLPGPIATKIASYVGYDVAGWVGVLFALIATVAPSAVALILLIKVLNKYRQSPVVKGMTLLVQPVIAVMMLLVTWESSRDSVLAIGWIQYLMLAAAAFYLMQIRRVHPAFVIIGAFIYGGVFLS
jgi:chromate transporter